MALCLEIYSLTGEVICKRNKILKGTKGARKEIAAQVRWEGTTDEGLLNSNLKDKIPVGSSREGAFQVQTTVHSNEWL